MLRAPALHQKGFPASCLLSGALTFPIVSAGHGSSKQKRSCKSLFGFEMNCQEFISHCSSPERPCCTQGFAAFCPQFKHEIFFCFLSFFCGWLVCLIHSLRYRRRKVLYRESGEVLEQLPREVVDAPSIPGGVQVQVGWDPGQPGLVLNMEVGGPACSRGVGTSWPFQPKPFYDSGILWSILHRQERYCF